MISSAASSVSVCSRFPPDGRYMTGWCSGRGRSLWHTDCVYLYVCETILTPWKSVSHNNTVTGWNNTIAHTHAHTHTHTQIYWTEQVSRLLFLPGCLLLRDKALFYVEKGWVGERGLCVSEPGVTARHDLELLWSVSSPKSHSNKKDAFLQPFVTVYKLNLAHAARDVM